MQYASRVIIVCNAILAENVYIINASGYFRIHNHFSAWYVHENAFL